MSRGGRPLACLGVFLRDSRTEACSFCHVTASENLEALCARDKDCSSEILLILSCMCTVVGTNVSLTAKIILADYNMSNSNTQEAMR